MDLNLQDSELLYTFDFGVQIGNLISDSELIWCVNSKDDGLVVKNIADKRETSLPYHNFGIASNGKFSIINGKDFEYNKQRYLLLSIEINKSSIKKYIMVIFKISTSKVICSFEVPNKITKIEVLVKNRHLIDNNKNPSLLCNFEVSAICGCDGGSIHIFDITPTEDLYSWESNENVPIEVYWYERNSTDLTDYDEIKRIRDVAIYQEKIFGLTLNRLAVEDAEKFKYTMPDDSVSALIPYDCAKITSMRYEKQIDSLIIGFNFGCFQIWNLKTMSIESSSAYGENNKPIIGFSLMQPQNDPKKCIYLMVAHSTYINSSNKLPKKKNIGNDESSLELKLDETDYEIDNDDDDESDSSFVLLYQLMFERSVNIYLNQNQYYILYEGLNYCAIVFEHELTFQTLQCVKTNYSSEFDLMVNKTKSSFTEQNDQQNSSNSSQSKIISIQTLNIVNNRLQVDLACIVWALIDKKMPNSTNYYLSVFNLNNWYGQCMPSKMRPLYELTCDGKNRFRKNTYFNNYTISLNNELEGIKMISIIDSKIKTLKNQNLLSINNGLRKLIDNEYYEEVFDEKSFMDSNLNDDTYLSMHFDLIVLASFSLQKLSINPIEHQIHNYISKQEDLIYHPDRVFHLLSRFHLLDKYLAENSNQPKFIPIFNYLFETSQIYPILKSLWKLNFENTSIISDCSLKAVLDWSWSKFKKIKNEINALYKLIETQIHNASNNINQPNQDIEREDLSEFLLRENNLLENLIQIYKHFMKLDTTNEGLAELNKKLCIIESLKFYVEHLTLFHKYDLLLMQTSNYAGDTSTISASDPQFISKNYTKEMLANLKLISNRWIDRRNDQIEQRELIKNNITNQEIDKKYPFTYMIDCLIEECLLFANTSKFFTKNQIIKIEDETSYSAIYPPKTLNQLLEVCLECNLSSKMKQVIILYALCDLMHTEITPAVQNHILKLINAYCSTKFTLMTNKLDTMTNSPWSTGSTNNDQDRSDSSSCLFDLVNGLYLIDSCLIEKAFKYLRAAELNYLEFYEKYFILYNSCNANQYKIAAQYLWLFQKLNASSIGSTDINNGTNQSNISANHRENQLESNESSILFRFFSKSSSQMLDLVNKSNQMHHEQRMHFRLIITIYLSNSLVNEAYDLIKPQIKLIKSSLSSSSTVNTNNLKISKELMIHFFNESERFKIMNKMIKISSLDNDFLLMLLSYLEAKQTLSSIAVAIDLHVTNRNYKRAIDLYERHAKQITNSEYNYLISIIDIAKEMSQSNNFSSIDDSTSFHKNKLFSTITMNDLKEVASFQYRFTVPFKELCKNSKRCSQLLNEKDDLEYIEILKLPELEFLNTNITIATNGSQKIVGQELTNLISNSMTPIHQSQLSKSSLQSSLKKRKASTPHQPFMKNNMDEELELEQPSTPTNITAANVIIPNNINNKFLSQSEFKSRVLTSSLKLSKNVSNSVSKSVKFKLVKYTREISDENKDYRDNEQNIEEEIEEQEEVVVKVKNSDNERRQLFLDEEDEDKEMMDQDVETKEEEKNIAEKNTTLMNQNVEEIENKIDANNRNSPNKKSIVNEIQIDLPILNNFDNLRKSIINNIVSTVSPVRGNSDFNRSLSSSPAKTITNPNISITKTKTVFTIVDDDSKHNQKEDEEKEAKICNQSDIEMEINEEPTPEEKNDILSETISRKSVQYNQLDLSQDHRVSPVEQIQQNNEIVENDKDAEEDETKIITTVKTTISTTAITINDENNVEKVNTENNCAMKEIIIEEVESKIELTNQIEASETKTNSNIAEVEAKEIINSEAETINTQEKSSDESSSLQKSGSFIFELTEENKADVSHNSINDSDITLNKSNEQDESFQLNMSSVSAHCENQSPSLNKPPSSQDHNNSNSKIKLPKEEETSRLSRTNSESSLFSHISSVSEHYEKLNKAIEIKIVSKPPAVKARPPQPKVNRLMDDNELNIIKKAAAEESNENSKRTGGAALRRRRSDLSSASSSASESSSAAAVAKIRANMQKLPPTLGSNDQEVRVTRSKLKALIEHPEQTNNDTPTPKKQARISRVKKQTLELVEELDEPAKMSISNLKKHNAAMEKLIEDNEEIIQDDHKRKIPSATARTTRSAKATRSPSPTASSIISDTTIASIQSQATSSASTKRRGRPPKAPSIVSSTASTKNLSQEIENLQDKTILKANELDNDEVSSVIQQTSPTNSVVSVASSIGASSVASSTASGRYTRRNRRTIQVDFNINEAEEEAKKQSVLTRSNSGRSYGLRSKDKSLRSSSNEAQTPTIPSSVQDNIEVEEKTKTRTTRAKAKINSSKI